MKVFGGKFDDFSIFREPGENKLVQCESTYGDEPRDKIVARRKLIEFHVKNTRTCRGISGIFVFKVDQCRAFSTFSMENA